MCAHFLIMLIVRLAYLDLVRTYSCVSSGLKICLSQHVTQLTIDAWRSKDIVNNPWDVEVLIASIAEIKLVISKFS